MDRVFIKLTPQCEPPVITTQVKMQSCSVSLYIIFFPLKSNYLHRPTMGEHLEKKMIKNMGCRLGFSGSAYRHASLLSSPKNTPKEPTPLPPPKNPKLPPMAGPRKYHIDLLGPTLWSATLMHLEVATGVRPTSVN